MTDSEPEDLSVYPVPSEVPLEERIQLAYKKWIDIGGKKGNLPQRKLALTYGIPPSTFNNRYNGFQQRSVAHEEQ